MGEEVNESNEVVDLAISGKVPDAKGTHSKRPAETG